MTVVPRAEYPRPQYVRNDWLCLNGSWQFEIDPADTGLERGLLDATLKQEIIVPFCPESSLSGIGYTDFMEAVWYRREVEIPGQWKGQKVLLHFQAVDYDATVWVNGKEVGRHRGGFTPFTCDLDGVAEPGEKAVIVVRARDPRNEPKPMGKQSSRYENFACLYTRTTGIWQTVWMEPVPRVYLKRAKITPVLAQKQLQIEQPISGNPRGMTFRAILKDDQGEVVRAEVAADQDFYPQVHLTIPDDRLKLWAPGEPNLYDLILELVDSKGTVVDQVQSYAGMRSITLDGMAVRINGKVVFQRLVLDQGYYPDGIMTAPTDEALVKDIELSIAAGFNGARLHQKVFEERFLYHADRMGYLIWGEFGDWFGDWGYGAWKSPNPYRHQPSASLLTQWLEALQRDYSHPCIVGWCPLNESFQKLDDQINNLDDVTLGAFLATKAMDSTRPVLDASGYSHRVPETDIYDSHDYEQNPERFAAKMAGLAEGKPFINPDPPVNPNEKPVQWSVPYRGQPYFVSEFGGIWWNPKVKEGEDSWGYGMRPKSLEEFYERFEKLCQVLLDNPDMFGYCYTQLTDVYQEQNGIYYFDRSNKVDIEKIRAVQARPAAIELKDSQ